MSRHIIVKLGSMRSITVQRSSDFWQWVHPRERSQVGSSHRSLRLIVTHWMRVPNAFELASASTPLCSPQPLPPPRVISPCLLLQIMEVKGSSLIKQHRSVLDLRGDPFSERLRRRLWCIL